MDIKNKIAVFKDGFKMEYNKLLIATGNTPKALSCKGKEVENVFNIRTPEDANRVVKLATSKNVVIVGASFLGELSFCRFAFFNFPCVPADCHRPFPSLSLPCWR